MGALEALEGRVEAGQLSINGEVSVTRPFSGVSPYPVEHIEIDPEVKERIMAELVEPSSKGTSIPSLAQLVSRMANFWTHQPPHSEIESVYNLIDPNPTRSKNSPAEK